MAEDVADLLMAYDEDDDDDDGLLLVPTVRRSPAKRHGRGAIASPQLVGVVANSDLEDPRAGIARWPSAMEHRLAGTHIIGFLVVVWVFCARDAPPSTEDICFTRSLGPRRYGEVLAYVDFSAVAARRLLPILELDGDVTLRMAMRLVRERAEYQAFSAEHGVMKDLVVVPWVLADALVGRTTTVLASVPLMRRTRQSAFPLGAGCRPTRVQIQSYIRQAPQATASRICDTLVVARPMQLHAFDPHYVLRFVNASRYLKQLEQTQDAGHAFVRAFFPTACDALLEARGEERVPSRTCLTAARARLDAAAMLMERNAWARKKDFGRCVPRGGHSMHLYYDSSPQAQHEIFATVLDSFDDVGHRTWTLPGTTLAHACQGAAGKLLALLWSMWMVFGPQMVGLEQALCETRSLSSDFGTESIIGAMHNVLDVFAATVGQKVSGAFLSYGHISRTR